MRCLSWFACLVCLCFLQPCDVAEQEMQLYPKDIGPPLSYCPPFIPHAFIFAVTFFHSLHPLWCGTQGSVLVISTFSLKTSIENTKLKWSCFVFIYFIPPRGFTQPTLWKGDLMLPALHNFLRGTAWILNRCICLIQYPSRNTGYLKIVWRFFHIKKRTDGK